MPTDETYVRAVDAAAAFGPWWAFAFAVLAVAAVIAWRTIPHWIARKNRELDIQEQREQRKREELAERAENDRRTAENSARMADAVSRSADSQSAVAAALEAVNAKFDLAADRSAHMGHQVETIAHKVDDIHAATVMAADRSRS